MKLIQAIKYTLSSRECQEKESTKQISFRLPAFVVFWLTLV